MLGIIIGYSFTNPTHSFQYRNEEGTLLSIHFYTVADYLHLLQRTSQLFNQLGRNAMIFLAAAVSDFYLPEDQLVPFEMCSSSL
jgi:phosphopantothenate-cysteine ligase